MFTFIFLERISYCPYPSKYLTRNILVSFQVKERPGFKFRLHWKLAMTLSLCLDIK